MRVVVLETPASLAEAVAALPAEGPLPARTVLVPSERHAHQLRRALSRAGAPGALAGTRLVGPTTAAREVLERAGVAFSPGEEALRPARLAALFREGLALERFDLALLRSTLGWDEAFADAIRELEAAGLGPADLPRDDPHARDLAAVWSRVAAGAGESLGAAAIHLRAAAILERDPGAWPFAGATLAPVGGHEDAAQARFLRAVPGITLGLAPARPARARHLDRLERLFGPEAREAASRPAAPPSAGSERELLAGLLFAPPEALAAPARPRSGGRDGTVELEEHAGVEAELEAAAGWVARKVLEDRLPLEEIAVLVPARDPLAQLVADRLARLPLGGAPLPVVVAGGVPAVSSAAGARVLAVVRALRAHLSAEALASVLPALRLEEAPAAAGDAAGRPRGHLSHGEALELAFSLGTAGGNAARPSGALEWPARAAARAAELEAALARARLDEDSSARERHRLARTLANLRAVRPALGALAGVAAAVVAGAPLAAIWDALSGFLARQVRLPGEGPPLPSRLAEALAPTLASALGSALAGPAALELVEDRLLALRDARGRFGDPAVYVGTVEGAAGLDFAAVRVLGLAEGVLPSPPREDPVLPERLRRALEGAGALLPRAEDRVAAQLHALLAAVRGARREVVLSAPRVDLARTEREPAALFLEAAAALGRPSLATGLPAGAAPDGEALRRDAYAPARASAAGWRAAHPVGEAAWLDRVARGEGALPPAWRADPALDLARVAALRAPVGPLGPADGVLGPGEPFPPLPGLDPARPISASALQQLVQCPRMFLMRRVLRWEEPAGAPSLREIDPAPFGSLLHRVLEELHRAHGAAFAARERSLAHWRAVALALADRLFDAFLSEYPLVGERIREKERERLRESVRAFLAYDWALPIRRHVGVELGFGDREPFALDAGGRALHVQGFVDRVDVEGDRTLVRDVKSGRPWPREGAEAGPTPYRDVQLGLYLLAARALAPAWRTPRRVAGAYAYASGRGEVTERAFREDAGALEDATRRWLATAARLLEARAFPPSPDADDCFFCPFRPLCGEEGPRRGAEGLALAGDDGPLAEYRALALGEEEDG